MCTETNDVRAQIDDELIVFYGKNSKITLCAMNNDDLQKEI